MFAMRLKLGTERNKEWRCCLCLHVRTATILFGLWQLVSIIHNDLILNFLNDITHICKKVYEKMCFNYLLKLFLLILV